MKEPKTILLLDADNCLGISLAGALRHAGHVVLTHSRADQPDNVTDLVAADVTTMLVTWHGTARPTPDHVVFGLRHEPESLASVASIEAIEQNLAATLSEIKAAVQLLIRLDESQIWVCLQEGSLQYYLPLPSHVIRTRALMATVKSLAKEVFSYGIKLNALHIQAMEEQFDKATWKAAKDGLKAFAIRFKPQKSRDVAALIQSLLETDGLPVTGMILPVGIGFVETNV